MRALIAIIFCIGAFFCGANGRRVESRIVGGILASIEEFPYQASFYYNNRFSCGGAILQKNVVITAAHCTHERSVSSMYIRAGTAYQGMQESSGKLIKVKQVIQHKEYNHNRTDYDVSLLILEEPLKYFFKIQPIALSPANDEELHGKQGTVTGWGLIREGEEEATAQLHKLKIPIYSQEFCKEIYGDIFTENMLCAGDINGGHDTCMGDSGGPLMYDKKLIGIVSWGYGCAQPGKPGLYSNVHKLTNWISEHLPKE